MKVAKIEKTVALANTGLTAILVVQRDGQQKSDEGDFVKASVSLYLPMQDPKGDDIFCNLHESIIFGERVLLFERNLRKNWGNFSAKTPGYRYHWKSFDASTWAEAMNGAMTYLESEVQKLVDALVARAKALVDAED